MKAKHIFILLSIVTLVAIGIWAMYWKPILWTLVIVGPLVLIGVSDMIQKKHTIKRNFPLIGNARYLLEKIRPEIMQYFVETDIEGRPINRMFRSLIYQRAKRVIDTVPFGTQMDVYEVGYEWMNHSMFAFDHHDVNPHPRITVGGPQCLKPYSSSLLNVSAMSFGSLSKNAIMALNKGCKLDDFALNTGEGGVSPYHKKYGGDLIWQIGTGYFGCRNEDGTFSLEKYEKEAKHETVKMIELKLSQGAKPGHGGILPAKKNTEEIAAIRGVIPGTDVLSPPTHSAFNTMEGLMQFIKKLRDHSGGKPVGFKLCIGHREEFMDLCKAMISTGIKPDFITVDGGEGGTGAAPIEFSNSLGMPMRDAVAFVSNTLIGMNLKDDIKIVASGMIISGFHIARTIALGADMVNSARAMMLAIGCIQALQCNNNSCPVGVATQNPTLVRGLDVENKAERVANYHHDTLHSFSELIAAVGIDDATELKRKHVYRRISETEIKRFDDIYPSVVPGSLLN